MVRLTIRTTAVVFIYASVITADIERLSGLSVLRNSAFSPNDSSDYIDNNVYETVTKNISRLSDFTTHPSTNLYAPSDSVIQQYVKDADLNFKELVIKYGYPVEEHIVVSEDGYILTIFRIPHGRSIEDIGPAVLMMHGFTDSADTWVFPGPNYGLGYLVADAGYDVWFPNYRGNKYSRKHRFLDPDRDAKFWEFSYDEMSAHDLPDITDYILKLRKLKKMSYVGFSQGTTIFYSMVAHKPKYYNKFSIMVSLAPVSWLTHLRNPHIRKVTQVLPRAHAFLKKLGVTEILSDRSLYKKSLGLICHDWKTNATAICRDILYELFGPDEDQFRYELIPVIYGHTPSGASLQNVIHLGQGVKNRRFQRFDWGVRENLVKYGSRNPPEYNVSLIGTPIALIYGKNDWLTSPIDVGKLRRRLPNVVDNYLVPRKKWQHSDHVWGREAPTLIGSRIIKLLKKYVK